MARLVITDKSRVPEMLRRLSDLNGTRIKVGIVGGGDGDLALIYAANELGTHNAGKNRNVTIPERPTLRATADSKKDIRKAFEGAAAVIDLDTPVLKALDIIGVNLAEAVREKIRSNVPPPNALSTVAGKNSARTLIGKTSRLVGAIKHEVV